jgi:hypothetical protein
LIIVEIAEMIFRGEVEHLGLALDILEVISTPTILTFFSGFGNERLSVEVLSSVGCWDPVVEVRDVGGC